jgi:ferredoxin
MPNITKPDAIVNPNLINEIKKFGTPNSMKCYNCGNCTAVCPLSTEFENFPRKIIRYAQLGLKDKILQSTEPWLCYYCGECSDTCPRGAEPGEMMMAIRRYQTSRYDWTGISKFLYTSNITKLFFGIFLALITGLIVWLFHGPIVLEHVELETFAPLHVVDLSSIVFALILSGLLLSNIGRMYWFTIKTSNNKISPSQYIKKFGHIISQFLIQLNYSKCTSKVRWINHLILMWGYTTIFILTAILLRYYLTNELYPITNPIRIFGYFGFIALTYATVYAIIGRLRKKETSRKFSHSTDWMFLILLLLTSISGIFVNFFKYLDMAMPTYITFGVHLAVVVPLLALEVPFGKWAHLAYRPFALYFSKLKELPG